MAKITKTEKGQPLNRTEVAGYFGVSLTTVDNWVRNGCPQQQRGKQGVAALFNSCAVHTWLVNTAVEQATGKGKGAAEPDGFKERLLAAQAEMAELELAKAKAEVIALPQVEKALSNAFASVQAAMRALPSRVARMVIGETDEARFKGVLLEEIDQALSALASVNLFVGGDDEALVDPDDLGDDE